MVAARVLVAGIGNIFLGDDAFGVEVVRRLAATKLPDDVRVVDFGIRGMDLAYALADGYESVILVDACPRGANPGTLFVLEPDLTDSDFEQGNAMLEAHSLDPLKVLRLAKSLGANIRQLLLIGCEPTPFNSDEDIQVELSKPVQAAVGEAVLMIESLLPQILSGKHSVILPPAAPQ